MTVETSIVKITLGNQNNTIYWGVTKNNIVTNFSESIYSPAFDTTNFSINY